MASTLQPYLHSAVPRTVEDKSQVDLKGGHRNNPLVLVLGLRP